jgi:hypothetical protein
MNFLYTAEDRLPRVPDDDGAAPPEGAGRDRHLFPTI